MTKSTGMRSGLESVALPVEGSVALKMGRQLVFRRPSQQSGRTAKQLLDIRHSGWALFCLWLFSALNLVLPPLVYSFSRDTSVLLVISSRDPPTRDFKELQEEFSGIRARVRTT